MFEYPPHPEERENVTVGGRQNAEPDHSRPYGLDQKAQVTDDRNQKLLHPTWLPACRSTANADRPGFGPMPYAAPHEESSRRC